MLSTLAPPDPPTSTTRRPGPVVTARGLTKRYQARAVVDAVDLTIEAGETFGLLGGNGAGKTTTVECLQGLRRPDAGEVSVLGRDPLRDRVALGTSVGSQLQDAALPDRLRVGEALELFGGLTRRAAVDALEPWGLSERAGTPFADLSGGQRQRLFVALALIDEPEVVYLDEVTQGLDPAARRSVWRAIDHIRDRGTTVVLVSHFAEEIEALCDRVAVMDRGRIVDTGTPREITDRHARHTEVRFTTPADFDERSVADLPGVDRIATDGARTIVAGTSSMIAPVCAATLDRTGQGPHHLHVHHPTLDDALVGLIEGTS